MGRGCCSLHLEPMCFSVLPIKPIIILMAPIIMHPYYYNLNVKSFAAVNMFRCVKESTFTITTMNQCNETLL